MAEEKVFVTEDIQMTSARSEYRSDKERSIQAVKNALDQVKGVPVNTNTETNIISSVPNFEHLNPELLALAILFPFYVPKQHKKKAFLDIPAKKAVEAIQTLLKLLFPSITLSSKEGLDLCADAIRYILLVQDTFLD
jgi:hypothetical protein